MGDVTGRIPCSMAERLPIERIALNATLGPPLPPKEACLVAFQSSLGPCSGQEALLEALMDPKHFTLQSLETSWVQVGIAGL